MKRSIVNSDDLTDDAAIKALGVELLSNCLEARKVLGLLAGILGQTVPLTSLSRLPLASSNTSRVFLVQCGRQGNSLTRAAARVSSDPVRYLQYVKPGHLQNGSLKRVPSPTVGL